MGSKRFDTERSEVENLVPRYYSRSGYENTSILVTISCSKAGGTYTVMYRLHFTSLLCFALAKLVFSIISIRTE